MSVGNIVRRSLGLMLLSPVRPVAPVLHILGSGPVNVATGSSITIILRLVTTVVVVDGLVVVAKLLGRPLVTIRRGLTIISVGAQVISPVPLCGLGRICRCRSYRCLAGICSLE